MSEIANESKQISQNTTLQVAGFYENACPDLVKSQFFVEFRRLQELFASADLRLQTAQQSSSEAISRIAKELNEFHGTISHSAKQLIEQLAVNSKEAPGEGPSSNDSHRKMMSATVDTLLGIDADSARRTVSRAKLKAASRESMAAINTDNRKGNSGSGFETHALESIVANLDELRDGHTTDSIEVTGSDLYFLYRSRLQSIARQLEQNGYSHLLWREVMQLKVDLADTNCAEFKHVEVDRFASVQIAKGKISIIFEITHRSLQSAFNEFSDYPGIEIFAKLFSLNEVASRAQAAFNTFEISDQILSEISSQTQATSQFESLLVRLSQEAEALNSARSSLGNNPLNFSAFVKQISVVVKSLEDLPDEIRKCLEKPTITINSLLKTLLKDLNDQAILNKKFNFGS